MQNKTMKRCLAALVTTIFVGGVLTALPLTAFAASTFHQDGGTIPEPSNYDYNAATDVINNGRVITNYGTISENNGVIVINSYNDEVPSNERTAGIVINNNQDTDTNYGKVVNNFGTVSSNIHLTTLGTDSGIVTNNFGTVGESYGNNQWYNQYEVTNNYGGTVTNNDTGYVKNQFYSISVTGPDDTDVTYGTGITRPIVSDAQGNTKRYIQVTNDQVAIDNISGTVTIATDADHEITGDDKL